MPSYTPNLNLWKGGRGDPDWDTSLNANFDILDAALTTSATGQTKSGALTINGLLTAGAGLTVSAGNILAAASILSVGTSATTAQANILSGAADRIGLIVDTAASPATNIQEWRNNGALRLRIFLSNSTSRFNVDSWDRGNDVSGVDFGLGRNISAGAVGPAAGSIEWIMANDTAQYTWIDATGDLRIHTAAPTGSSGAPTVSDTAGGVVGDQTSYWRRKTNITEWEDYEVALSAIVNAKLYSFQYAQSSYLTPDNRPQTFYGPVIWEEDLSGNGPWYGKNLGRQQEPSLNEITGLGYSFAAIKALHTEITRLKARVADLEVR